MLENYARELEELLDKCVVLAGGKTDSVFVLSIPDWSVTPFAGLHDPNKQDPANDDRDDKKIRVPGLFIDTARVSREIRQYNEVSRRIASEKTVNYLEITAETDPLMSELPYLVDDRLHPSGKIYERWAERLTVEVLDRYSCGQQKHRLFNNI